MSALAGSLPAVDVESVEAIAQDLFATMIDGEPGLLLPGYGAMPPLAQPRFTWVDVEGMAVTRVLVAVGRGTGDDLTRALLMMPADASVSEEDFADAVGEVVNMIGGNIKSLVDGGGSLTLPRVSDTVPDSGDVPLIVDVWFTWRGAPLNVTLWNLPRVHGVDDDPKKER